MDTEWLAIFFKACIVFALLVGATIAGIVWFTVLVSG